MMSPLPNLQACMADTDALLITAGAGMGVDSGLPDFRGNEGFWKAYPPLRHLGIGFSDMANPHWFEQRPQLAWGFYGHRLHLYRQTKPHAGFTTLLHYAQSRPSGYGIFTSNVDGQFQRAGFDDQVLLECHGSIHHLQCTEPCCDQIWSAESLNLTVDPDSFMAALPLPTCPSCGCLARPNILMFGDGQWISRREQQQDQNLNHWLQRAHGKKVTILELGAGEAVPTVRYFSERVAEGLGATLIRINPRDSHVPAHINAHGLAMGAAEGIAALLAP
ncbi:SIR2 family NAD-dependent protein deacylase [Magnetococcus sp. PR-3]|uniref:SIR2 family NAD-dependent protein deacylase n=1 Tax=Magnetococcus sp. PR-3 TaxID=3120355 RepID=UPI002FCE2EC4